MHAPTGRNQGKRIHSNEFRGSVNPSQFKMHEPSEPIYRGPIFKSMITKVARVSVPNGIIFLSVGTEHGISKGEVFFLEKEGKPTARIKISEAKPKYCVANILPRFGNPRSLQAGDQVKVVR